MTGTTLVQRREEQEVIPILRVIREGSPGRSKYSDEEKLSAAMGYACTGQMTKASDLTGLPYEVIKDWRRCAEWWEEALAWCRREKQDELDGLFTEIIDLSMNQIRDRIDKGDIHYDEDGNQTRRPVSLKELAIISGIAFDKRQLVRGDPNRITENRKSTEELVDSLISGFVRLSENLTEREKSRIIEVKNDN